MKATIKKIMSCFVLYLLSCNAYTQNNALDSLQKVLLTQKEDSNKVNTLAAISRSLLLSNDYNKALQYANKAILLSENIGFKKGKGNSLLRSARIHMLQNNYTEAERNALESLRIKEELNDKQGCVNVYAVLSGIYGMQGFYAENLKYTYAALKLSEELEDKELIVRQLNDLANIYNDHGNQTEGLKNALKALKIGKEIEYKRGIAVSTDLIGEISFNNGNYNEALKYHLTALKQWEELGNNADIIGYLLYCYKDIGRVYGKQGELAYISGDTITALIKFSEAQKIYLKALDGFEKTNDKSYASELYTDIGNINIKLKNFTKARSFLQTGLKLSKEAGFKNAIRNSYQGLSTLDSIKGDYQQAYINYKSYILYRDSILNDESMKKSSEIKMQYEFDKKETIAKAEQDKKEVEFQKQNNQQRWIIFSVLAALFSALIVAWLIFRSRQKEKTANRLLHLQNTEIDKQKNKLETALSELKATQNQLIQKEKLASLGELTAGIAHEIQNPLNFVNNFSELSVDLVKDLKEEIEKPDIDKEYVGELFTDLSQNQEKINHHGKRASSIVKGMLEHSRASTGVKELTDINKLADEYLRLSYHGLRAKDKSFNSDFKTDFDENLPKIEVIPQDIGRVLLNLINNAFWAVNHRKLHSSDENYTPSVSVTTKQVDNAIEIRVKDNGSGMPDSVKAKVFQPFFTTKPTGQGTGLGLSLAYDIVTKGHGGALEVESTERVGTEFIIHLGH